MDPKMVVKLFRLTGAGFMLISIGGLLTVYVDTLQDKDIKKLRERVLTLEAQVMNLNLMNDILKKAEEAKENEEVDAE